MSEPGNKELPVMTKGLPEGVVSGKPSRKPKELDRVMCQMAARLRRHFADEIAADPRGFKKRATHYLKRYLPPFAGRPSEASITAAIKLHKEGRPWHEIYPQAVPGHSTLEGAVRRQAESNIRAAVRSRRNTAKRRKRQLQLIAETTSALNVSSRRGPATSPTLGA